MIRELNIETKQEVLALISDVAYSIIPDWYGRSCRNLKMNLILPRNRTNHPAQPCLLFICGGAFSVVSASVWLPELMYFARRGYTVATVNYRTSNEAPFPAALIDVKSAVRFLKAHAEQFCIDPERIVVSGESAGGTLCALTGVTASCAEFEQGDYLDQDSSVAAVVDYYGLSDMIENRSSDSDAVQPWAMEAFLGVGYTREQAMRASAIHYISADTPPFMILHGTKDPLVDIESQSDRLYEKLCANGVYAEYLKLRDAGHGDDAFYQDAVKAHVLAFMNKVLGV